MGVYIKGVNKKQLISALMWSAEMLPADFEITEVAEPHGRLIDIEKALANCESIFDIRLDSKSAPTVIEAEDEKGEVMTETRGFDYAIVMLKRGYKLKRLGWNGKDQYIELATKISYKNPDGVFIHVDHEAMGNKAIAFHGTSGVQLGWLASQADMLAEDWVIAE